MSKATEDPGRLDSPLSDQLGPLPLQREGQYLTMTVCGTSDDPAERGHWSSPAYVQWRIDKAVAAERERCAQVCEAEHVGASLTAADLVPCDESYNMALQHAAAAIRGPNVGSELAPTAGTK